MEAAKVKDGKTVPTLRVGDRVVVTQGPLAGVIARADIAVAIADGLPNQRKVKVTIEGEGTSVYILPRQIELAPDTTRSN